MKKIILICIALFSLTHSKAQEKPTSPEENKKYLDAVDMAWKKIQALPKGRGQGTYHRNTPTDIGTIGKIINGKIYDIEVIKEAHWETGEVPSMLVFSIRDNNPKTKHFPMTTVQFYYNHVTERGQVSWYTDTRLNVPDKIRRSKDEIIEKIDYLIAHLDEYI